MSELFEYLAATDDSERVKTRTATAVANKRVKDRYETFLANATSADRKARLALIEDDIENIVADVVSEYGGNPQRIEAAIRHSIEIDPNEHSDEEHGGKCYEHGRVDCPLCEGTKDRKEAGNADHLKEYQFKKKDDSAEVEDEPAEEEESEEGVTASRREARRPKMCPYHSEVVDISLGTGDPQAGYNALSNQAWGDNHCKGGFDGSCNFKPAMVAQKYWDDKKEEYMERARQRAEQMDIPSLEGTEPVMNPEPFPEGEGEGVTDIDAELAEAPSAVGEVALAHTAADAPKGAGGAVKRVKLPTGDETALGGPSPKIDKGESGSNEGWTLDPIDSQMDNSRHPTEDQDIAVKADMYKDDFRAQTDAVSKQEDLPPNKGDAGFTTERNIEQPHTDTWTEAQNDPVTSDKAEAVLSSTYQDYDKNPLREIIESNYGGFLPASELDSAIMAHEANDPYSALNGAPINGSGLPDAEGFSNEYQIHPGDSDYHDPGRCPGCGIEPDVFDRSGVCQNCGHVKPQRPA